MSVSISKQLDTMDETRMVLENGYAWREKVTEYIWATWRRQPWYKRAYWTLRGKRPVA